MVALLIEDVTLVKAERVAIHVRFRGGRTTSLEIDKPKPIAIAKRRMRWSGWSMDFVEKLH